MPFSVALAGKGGTGKTTVAGMLVGYLIRNKKTPVLAVDADSNANFNEVLGLEVTDTIGTAREEMKRGAVPSGMTKDVFLSMKLEESVVESDGVDLVVMGQPEGAGCYCAANTLLAGFLDKLTGNYPYLIMDNEAGMEHISRLTTKNVDLLLLVSDPSRRGLQAAVRIHKLVTGMKIVASQTGLIVNRCKEPLSEEALQYIADAGLTLLGTIPDDGNVYEYDFDGRPTVDLPADSEAISAAGAIFEKVVP